MWYRAVTTDYSKFSEFFEFYEKELEDAKREMGMKSGMIEKHVAELPGLVEKRYGQLQEIEAILEYLNIQMTKDRSIEFKNMLETYHRALSSKDAEKYVDGIPRIVDLALLINEVALLRNKYLGVSKGLEQKSFSLSNIVKLRVAGLDDAAL